MGKSLTTVGEIETMCERVVPIYHFQLQNTHIYTFVHIYIQRHAFLHTATSAFFFFFSSFRDIVNKSQNKTENAAMG